MGRNYRVDEHERKNEIIRAMLAGEKPPTISKEYGISANAIRNYWEKLGRTAALSIDLHGLEVETREDYSRENLGRRILQRLEENIPKLQALSEKAEKAESFAASVGAIREIRESYETLAKLVSTYAEISKSDIRAHPQYAQLLQALRRTFEDDPERVDEFERQIAQLSREGNELRQHFRTINVAACEDDL